MLQRIVRMTFDLDQVEDFRDLFDRVAPRIKGYPGCRHLTLLQDTRYSNIFSTYSVWDSEQALQAYRESDLFLKTWASTKNMFAAPPQAHSYAMVQRVD